MPKFCYRITNIFLYVVYFIFLILNFPQFYMYFKVVPLEAYDKAFTVVCTMFEYLNLLCEISSSRGGEYDVQSCLLGYTVV
jgi:hypothetical protein